MKRVTTFGILLLGLVLALPAIAQTDVSGNWEGTLQTPQGARAVKLILKQEGDKVTGTIDGPTGQVPLAGTLTGSDLNFVWTVDANGQSISITMAGKVEGSSIAGSATFGGFGDGTWTAKRMAAGGVAGRWDITLSAGGRDFPSSATLTQEGETLSGAFAGPGGDSSVKGTLSGKALTLSIDVNAPQGALTITLTGDVDGDSIVNGTADFGAMGQGTWSGVRAKP